MAKSKPHPLLGFWKAKDDWVTAVGFTISRRGDTISVRATDMSDGEEAEIYGLKVTKRALSFAAYWSSGRFTKYQFRTIGVESVEVQCTYTETTEFYRDTPPKGRRRKK